MFTTIRTLYFGGVVVSWALFLMVATLDGPFIVNLNGHCLQCLCHAATQCNITAGCVKGYCGPYKVSKLYWIDGGKATLPADDQERAGAYEDCAISYHCAQRIVRNYLQKFGRDCNGDGITDCDDYAMINFNGGYGCTTALDRSEAGNLWLQRYKACNPETNL